MNPILDEISALLQKGRAPLVKEAVQKAIDENISAEEILNDGLMAGMNIIGSKFKMNEVFVPEVLVAARAMNAGIAVLQPLLAKSGMKSHGTVVLGTVKGDMHDIGKNLVKIMMEGKGLKVIDIGVDVTTEAFVKHAKENGAKIVACSSLLTTTMIEMKNIVDAIRAEGLNVKVMVGGAPVTDAFCESIGADKYAPDAASAADAAVALCAAV